MPEFSITSFSIDWCLRVSIINAYSRAGGDFKGGKVGRRLYILDFREPLDSRRIDEASRYSDMFCDGKN